MKFSYYVRPICLNFKGNEKPVCPDQSRDRFFWVYDRNYPGGCATVAGWGSRYNQFTMDDEKYANCRTDADDFSPDKLQYEPELSWREKKISLLSLSGSV